MEHISKALKEPGVATQKDSSGASLEKWSDTELLPPIIDTGCDICGGYGFVHPKRNGVVVYSEMEPCKCTKAAREERIKKALLMSCGLPPNTGNMTFGKFKQYREVITAYNDALEVSQKPGEPFWLTLLGDNGNGKTHLAIAVVKEWLKAGIPAKYVLTSLLLDELREGYNRERAGDYENSYYKRFEHYCNVPLLLLDDYGIQSGTPWVQEKLETLLDYRLMHKLSLLVTSNLSLEEIPSRIRSRLWRPGNKVVAILAGDYSARMKR